MESNRTEYGKAAETGSQPTTRDEDAKKALAPTQTVLWTIGILAAFSVLFLALSLIGPSKG